MCVLGDDPIGSNSSDEKTSPWPDDLMQKDAKGMNGRMIPITFGTFLKNHSESFHSPVTLKKGLPAVTFEEGVAWVACIF